MAEQTPVAGQTRIRRRDYALLGAAVVALLVALIGFYVIQSGTHREDTWIDLARSISQDVNSVVKIGEDATHGVAPDFTTLAAAADNIDGEVRALAQGDADAGIVPAPAAAQPQVQATDAAWKQMRQTVDALLAGEKAFEATAEATRDFVAAIHTSDDPAQDTGLYHDYEQIAERLGQRGAGAGQLFLVSSQLVRLERMAELARRVLARGRDAKQAATQLDAEAKTFAHNNDILLGDASIAAQVQQVKQKFDPLLQAAATVLANADAVDKLQTAAGQLRARSTDVIATADALQQKLRDTRVKYVILPVVIYLAVALAIVALAAFVLLNIAGVRERMRRAAENEARQQQAILNLLDEITNLANGDLTVDVTVTEDFTGAIADSINYTVQTLRSLVGTINQTSIQVAQAAASTQDSAARMSQASDRQAREITAAANAITATSQQLQDVAGRAEKIAVQAQGSVQLAHNGAATVGRTIHSMAALREQIQDTAKRIKRLGESSQEIGNIIEFINDIAEQTNTLALNASIQAAMAGEAGRGFAVVADEVQRLAERAASATRQIETLVKTIQADTQEAVTSMERSTANVVTGAQSAEEAGQALTRIESSSQEVANSIQGIAAAVRAQSAEATKAAGIMQGVREIAVQTSASARTTAQAIGELNTLSAKLRESVAGFKLPEAAASS
jgi:twitching motility protein PilJ